MMTDIPLKEYDNVVELECRYELRKIEQVLACKIVQNIDTLGGKQNISTEIGDFDKANIMNVSDYHTEISTASTWVGFGSKTPVKCGLYDYKTIIGGYTSKELLCYR